MGEKTYLIDYFAFATTYKEFIAKEGSVDIISSFKEANNISSLYMFNRLANLEYVLVINHFVELCKIMGYDPEYFTYFGLSDVSVSVLNGDVWDYTKFAIWFDNQRMKDSNFFQQNNVDFETSRFVRTISGYEIENLCIKGNTPVLNFIKPKKDNYHFNVNKLDRPKFGRALLDVIVDSNLTLNEIAKTVNPSLSEDVLLWIIQGEKLLYFPLDALFVWAKLNPYQFIKKNQETDDAKTLSTLSSATHVSTSNIAVDEISSNDVCLNSHSVRIEGVNLETIIGDELRAINNNFFEEKLLNIFNTDLKDKLFLAARSGQTNFKFSVSLYLDLFNTSSVVEVIKRKESFYKIITPWCKTHKLYVIVNIEKTAYSIGWINC